MKRITINTMDLVFLVDATEYIEYDAVKKFNSNDNIDVVSKIRREFINGEREHSGRSDRVDERIGINTHSSE